MNRLDLYQLERLAGAIACRVHMLLNNCQDSDHNRIGDPVEQEKLLLACLCDLEKWFAEYKTWKKS